MSRRLPLTALNPRQPGQDGSRPPTLGDSTQDQFTTNP